MCDGGAVNTSQVCPCLNWFKSDSYVIDNNDLMAQQRPLCYHILWLQCIKTIHNKGWFILKKHTFLAADALSPIYTFMCRFICNMLCHVCADKCPCMETPKVEYKIIRVFINVIFQHFEHHKLNSLCRGGRFSDRRLKTWTDRSKTNFMAGEDTTRNMKFLFLGGFVCL